MPSLAEFQADFAAALGRPGATVPDTTGAGAMTRMDVYRNNVWASLADALAAACPVTAVLLGADFFRAAAVDFARERPPVSPVLLTYGDGFAEHLARYPALAYMLWVPDVVRLERAWLEVYHAADAAPLDPASLAGLSDEDTGRLRFAAHPAVQRLDLTHAVLEIWRRHRESDQPGRLRLPAVGQHLMILRPRQEVAVLELSTAEAALADGLLSGQPLAEAVAKPAACGNPDLPATLGRLLACGCFTSHFF